MFMWNKYCGTNDFSMPIHKYIVILTEEDFVRESHVYYLDFMIKNNRKEYKGGLFSKDNTTGFEAWVHKQYCFDKFAELTIEDNYQLKWHDASYIVDLAKELGYEVTK